MYKALYYLLALLLAPIVNVVAQNKIEGLGKFKIGKTDISIVEEVAKELNGKVERISIQVAIDEYGIMKPSISELVKDDKMPVEAPLNIYSCPTAKTFYINKYKIADMQIVGIYLIFNENTLVKLICQSDGSLSEALEIKYGDTPLSTTKDTLKCYHSITGSETLLEQVLVSRKWTNGDIVAENRGFQLYDKNCKPYKLSDFVVRDEVLYKKMLACEEQYQSNGAINRKAERKEKLKDF